MEESRLKKAKLNRRVVFLRVIAVAIVIMIVTSSVAALRVVVESNHENDVKSVFDIQSIPTRPCKVKTVLSQGLPWVSFDSAAPGTPVETHVLISDTTGIVIVADFYGFWRGNHSIDADQYDDLEMPGASYLHEPGNPMLPFVTEVVEIPHDIDVSLEILTSSSATETGYTIRPAPPLYLPVPIADDLNATPTTLSPEFLGPVYSQNASFPGVIANAYGNTSTTTLIMRGHRLLELNLCPIQYNPVTGVLVVYSQIVVKLKYSSPAQIQPVPISLYSDLFERILQRSVLNYDTSHFSHQPLPGQPISYIRTDLPPSMPNATVPLFHQSSTVTGKEPGAEYLVITTNTFKDQAHRLVEWKERKGVPSRLEIIPEEIDSDEGKRIFVRETIEYAYNHWHPVPTYVLLFGDVEAIPTNYDMEHTWEGSDGSYFEQGFFASDLSYFTPEGNGFIPDIIYSRISVDTEEQAEIVVNKTLQYEQSPPEDVSFYKNILTAGYFEDKNPRDGVEDSSAPFLYHLESIRQYLQGLDLDYTVHYNYSGAADPSRFGEGGDSTKAVAFHAPLQIEDGTRYLADYGLDDSEWIWSYYANPQNREFGNANISANINDGRFLVMYYSHGGSKNMIYPYTLPQTEDNRDYTEGWYSPCFNESHFSFLDNNNKTPLILSIACSTGWFDGETDQESCILFQSGDLEPSTRNLFEVYDQESFAELLTRMKDGGAIAVIAPSRQAPSRISGDLLDGIVQAFWPGFLGFEHQSIYEMGGALFYGKVYAADDWLDNFSSRDVARMIYEEYHLFGDPETQLWTGEPSKFNVSYPPSIGTYGEQKFVVTVRDNVTGEPVNYAKVCVQQIPEIYEVGYTDSNGQVIFNVEPPVISWSLNVTVTKHNYIPHLGEISIIESDKATVIVTPNLDDGSVYTTIDITISGFDDGNDVQIWCHDSQDDYHIGIMNQRQSVTTSTFQIPEGSAEYVTVRAEQDNTGLVATSSFYRLESDNNPDPYIYSQRDRTTWDLAGNFDEPIWNNPCITIYDDETPVDHLEQGITYDVVVTVYNRGNVEAVGTDVTLLYASSLGSASWSPSEPVSVPDVIPVFGSGDFHFEWTPERPNFAILNVTIFHTQEREEDRVNNMGFECWNVFPLCSVGESAFEVENPSDESEYVTIDVKQEGDHENVWSASIQDYEPQSLDPGQSEEATLVVDPSCNIAIGRDNGRTFTAEIIVNDELVLGMEFSGFCPVCYRAFFVGIFLAGIIFFVIILLYFVWKRL